MMLALSFLSPSCKQRLSAITTLRLSLHRALKSVLAELAERRCDNGRTTQEASGERALLEERALEERKAQLERMLLQYNGHMLALTHFLPVFARTLSLLSEQLIQRMILELETGGNVRFEDGVMGQTGGQGGMRT